MAFDDFFQRGGGKFAPAFTFANVGDSVAGEIVSIEQQDQTDLTTGQPRLDPRTGQAKQQLQVILQTNLRGWQGVNSVPTNRDPNNPQPLPASEDDGKRAVYVKGWMTGAVGEAVEKATGVYAGPEVGGKLAIRFSGTRPAPGKPQPIKLYQAHYQPPTPGAAMFDQPPVQQQAPVQQQTWNPPAQQSQPPVQQQSWNPPAAAPDPWQNYGEPPF